MVEAFFQMSEQLFRHLRGAEQLYLYLQAEQSDFVRFNQGRIRQPGYVEQAYLNLDLVDGGRHAQARISLGMGREGDLARSTTVIDQLRSKVAMMPVDPHLYYNPEVEHTAVGGARELPSAAEMTEQILEAAKDLDLVGILARGPMQFAFASSTGHRNRFESSSFHFDWSLYHHADKAVKCSYAGKEWDRQGLESRMAKAKEQWKALDAKPKSLSPGHYRVFLAPAAVMELLSMLNWNGFGLKAQRTRQSSLLRLALGEVEMSDAFTLRENTREGTAPNFQSEGFIKPDLVTLIDKGRFASCMVSGRSSREFGILANGAGPAEAAESMAVDPGDLAEADILKRLDTGLLINNLWYLNYSDRPACRLTGMTRFACFWVEKGKIKAPLDVMRFDESLYRVFGSNLMALTKEREMLLDSRTYEARSASSFHLPGALVEDFCFNL